MLNLSSLARSSARSLVLVPAFALAAVACSSGGETANEAAAGADVAAQESVDGSAENTGSADGDANTDATTDADGTAEGDGPDCEVLLEARFGLQGRGQTLASMEDVDLIAETFPPAVLDEMDAQVDLLRPYQDVEGVLGSPREGLDKLTADIAAVREGRLDDRVGGHGYATLNAMLDELC